MFYFFSKKLKNRVFKMENVVPKKYMKGCEIYEKQD